MNICLLNEASIAPADFKVLVDAITSFVPLVTKAWSLPDTKVTTVPVAGDWLIHVTVAKRHLGASAYHTVENGLPTAYCLPRRLFGYYSPGFVNRKGKRITPERFTEGCLTSIAHEIAEMLCDPVVQTVSKPDSQGRPWLIEVCDHVFGNYVNHVIDGKNCVLPDVTVPSFYDVQGKAPYSLFCAVPTPFTLTKSGYGYWKNKLGALVKL